MRLAFLALSVVVLSCGVGRASPVNAESAVAVDAQQRELEATAQLGVLRRFMARQFIYCRLADGNANRTYYSELFSVHGQHDVERRTADYATEFRWTVQARFAGARGDAGCSADGDASVLEKRFHGEQYQDVIQHNEILLTGWSPGGSQPQDR
jgi:hypothetical protein